MKITLISVLSLFLLAGLLYSCGGKARDDQNINSEAEYAIAYNVLVDGENINYEVFTMNIDGAERMNITNLPEVEWSYFSYRDKVFFISDKSWMSSSHIYSHCFV